MTNFTRLMTPFAKRSLAECMRASGPESRYNPCSQCSSRDVAGRNPVCLSAGQAWRLILTHMLFWWCTPKVQASRYISITSHQHNVVKSTLNTFSLCQYNKARREALHIKVSQVPPNNTKMGSTTKDITTTLAYGKDNRTRPYFYAYQVTWQSNH